MGKIRNLFRPKVTAEEAEEISRKLLSEQRYHNAIVKDYNAIIETFPSSIIAALLSYKKAEPYSIEGTSAEKS